MDADELTEQTAGVAEAKITGSPELAVAFSVTGADVLMTSVGIVAKDIVCAASVTAKLCVTVGAEAYTGLPAWLATIVQVPAPARVAVEAAIVQVLGVTDEKLTGRPELAVADKASVVPAVCGEIAANVMV